MANGDEPSRSGRSLSGIDRWIERHEDHHIRDRAEQRGEIDDAELRLQERMTTLERKQSADHASSVGQIGDLAKIVDGIQSVLDQQRGARNLLVFIGGASMLQVVATLILIWKTVA